MFICAMSYLRNISSRRCALRRLLDPLPTHFVDLGPPGLRLERSDILYFSWGVVVCVFSRSYCWSTSSKTSSFNSVNSSAPSISSSPHYVLVSSTWIHVLDSFASVAVTALVFSLVFAIFLSWQPVWISIFSISIFIWLSMLNWPSWRVYMVASVSVLLDVSYLTFLSMVSTLVMIFFSICLRLSLVALLRSSLYLLVLAMVACSVDIAVYFYLYYRC